MYQLLLWNEQKEWENTGTHSNKLHKMIIEAKDLQRILSEDRKESGCYYAVFKIGNGGKVLQFSMCEH